MNVRAVVVIPVRLVPGDGRALALAWALEALANQTTRTGDYRVVIVEDSARRSKAAAGLCYTSPVSMVLHRRNPGPFSRGAALNYGVRNCGAAPDDVLCLMDGDLWVPDRWVEQGMRQVGRGRAVLPYERVCYLTKAASEALLKGTPPEGLPVPRCERVSRTAVGGALWLTRDLFDRVGGYDEEYQGWGCEDDDMLYRLVELGRVTRLQGERLVHLWHRPAPRDDRAAERNLAIFRDRWNGRAPVLPGFYVELVTDCGTKREGWEWLER